MEGLVEEGSEAIESDFEGAVKDSDLIAAARRVEHYEMAGYAGVRSFAELLGETDAVNLLTETLDEEQETEEKLTELATEINAEANGGSGDNESEQETARPRVMKAKAGR
jgi:ferritin-like metal-binding protein YciE